ncbi:MAG: class I SAM-dependent methyltransferase [Candidatus Sericytochromatia bacterium]
MRRCQLLEFEDLDWFPRAIRDGGTACLRALGKAGGMGRFMAPPLAEALRKTGQRRLIDLCSGGAGPLPEVLAALAEAGLDVQATLTDKFPNIPALSLAAAECAGRVDFAEGSVDATDVPAELTGFRTLFNAFHHFPPELARGILADAVRKQVPIAVFEVVGRSPEAVAAVLLSPLMALLLMPTIQPQRPEWWFFTYLVPLIPAMLLWDGLVSCLRVYSPDELRELIAGIEANESFDWSIDSVVMSPLPLRSTILIGSPR